MQIALTKHCKQRRDYLPVTPDEHLIKWTKFFIKKFNMRNLENGSYKIYGGKGNAVLRKINKKIVVITFRGYENYDIRDSLNIKIRFQEERVFIDRPNGKVKVAGSILWEDDKAIVTIKNDIFETFDIGINDKTHTFENIEELREVFDFIDRKWILKSASYRNGISLVMRKNFKGVLVNCGTVKDGVLKLHHSLLNKFKINPFPFTPCNTNLERFIHFDETLNTWLLNDFPRRTNKNKTTD